MTFWYVRMKRATYCQEKKQILERWQQYFKELLNPEFARIKRIKPYECPINKQK
jgi:hypothetical protein